MNWNYAKILLFFLLINTISFGQKDTSDITGEGVPVKDSVTIQPPSELNKADEEVSPEKVNVGDHVGGSVEIAKQDKDSIKREDNSKLLPVQKDKKPVSEYKKENFSDIDLLREDAKILQEQAEKLYKMADDFEDESDKIDDAMEDLEDNADDLEDEAEELLKQARLMQKCIRLSTEASEIIQLDSTDTGKVVSDTMPSEEYMKDQKILMLQMRNSADRLLIKAKKIAIKVREMGEASDAKDELSDKFEDKADRLEDKAEELEDVADQLEEKQNLIPLQVRYPFQIGHQIRFSTVPPYRDSDPHVLILSGINISRYITYIICIGIEDITLRFNETIYGTRIAVMGSPLVSFSFFPAMRCELGVGIGTAVQGQVGAHRSSNVALAPFIKLFNENWVANHFSLGPVVKVNFLPKGQFVTRSLPFDKSKVLPEKAGWIDFGITYKFHF